MQLLFAEKRQLSFRNSGCFGESLKRPLSRVRWWKGERPGSLNKLNEAVEFELAAYVEE